MSSREYSRAERTAGVTFVAGLGLALLGAALAYGAADRWEIAALVGGIFALATFVAAGLVGAALSDRRPPDR